MFGVEALYASAHSLQERGLDGKTLILDAAVLVDADLPALIDRYDQVITL